MSDAAISLYGVRHKETAKILTRTLRIEMERDRERKEDRRERKTVIFLFFFFMLERTLFASKNTRDRLERWMQRRIFKRWYLFMTGNNNWFRSWESIAGTSVLPQKVPAAGLSPYIQSYTLYYLGPSLRLRSLLRRCMPGERPTRMRIEKPGESSSSHTSLCLGRFAPSSPFLPYSFARDFFISLGRISRNSQNERVTVLWRRV